MKLTELIPNEEKCIILDALNSLGSVNSTNMIELINVENFTIWMCSILSMAY